jgi:hypothetical protein
MGITFTRLFNRLFSKKEIRILMVRAPHAWTRPPFFSVDARHRLKSTA